MTTTTVTIDNTTQFTGQPASGPRWAKTAGLVYVAAWGLGLAAFGSGPATTATDAEVAHYFAGHRMLTAGQATLIHGVAAFALLGVLVAVRRIGASSRTANAAGLTAVSLSLLQYGLDLWRSLWSTGSTTAALVHVIDRIDGFKMFALAVMIAASIRVFGAAGLVGSKMAVTGRVAAGSLVLSGLGYALDLSALAPAAELSLVLLLTWVGYTGFAVARHTY